jgi:hypothetical protein
LTESTSELVVGPIKELIAEVKQVDLILWMKFGFQEG